MSRRVNSNTYRRVGQFNETQPMLERGRRKSYTGNMLMNSITLLIVIPAIVLGIVATVRNNDLQAELDIANCELNTLTTRNYDTFIIPDGPGNAVINITFTSGPPGSGGIPLTTEQKDAILTAVKDLETIIENDATINIEVYAGDAGGLPGTPFSFIGKASPVLVTFHSSPGKPDEAYNVVRAAIVQRNPGMDAIIPTYCEFSASLPINVARVYPNWKPKSMTMTTAHAKFLGLFSDANTLERIIEPYSPDEITLGQNFDGSFLVNTNLNSTNSDLNPNDGVGFNLTRADWDTIRFDRPSTFPDPSFNPFIIDFQALVDHEILHILNFIAGGELQNGERVYETKSTIDRYGLFVLDLFRLRDDQIASITGPSSLRTLPRYLKYESFFIFDELQEPDGASTRTVFKEQNTIRPTSEILEVFPTAAGHVFVTGFDSGSPVSYKMSPDFNGGDFFHFRSEVDWIYDENFDLIGYSFNTADFSVPGPFDEMGNPLYGQTDPLMETTGSRNAPAVITYADADVLRGTGFIIDNANLELQNQFAPP